MAVSGKKGESPVIRGTVANYIGSLVFAMKEHRGRESFY